MTDNVKKDITQLRISGMGYGRIFRQLGRPVKERDFALMVAG